jgi:hypothetical protein
MKYVVENVLFGQVFSRSDFAFLRQNHSINTCLILRTRQGQFSFPKIIIPYQEQ